MFRYDNGFFQWIGKAVDYIFASFLWLVFCIPVVTIGVSTAALFYTVHKSLKGGRDYVFHSFWHSFRENLKCTIPGSVVYVLVFLFLVYDKAMFLSVLEQGSQLGFLYYVFYFLQLYIVGIAIVTFAFAARFTCTPTEMLKKGLRLSLGYFPWTALMILTLVVSIVIVSFSPIFLFVLPALDTWLFDWILERIFRKIMTPEQLAEELELEEGK